MAGKEVITLKQVLAHMASTADPFTLRWVKFNEQKNEGGEIVEAAGLLQSARGEQPATAAPSGGTWHPAGEVRRRANHFKNFTRNLKSTLNGNFSKVHIYLILEFNGKKVII
jgi:hypothetical protein